MDEIANMILSTVHTLCVLYVPAKRNDIRTMRIYIGTFPIKIPS